MNLVRFILLIVALGLVAAAPAAATFPGEPGPIAYSKKMGDDTGQTGGLFAHPPQLRAPAKALTTSPNDASPSFSEDGRLIVFAGNRDPVPDPSLPFAPEGRYIFVMKADGSDVRQLTSGDVYDSNPAFSRGGQVVVFDRMVGASRRPQIYSVPVAGGEPKQLTSGPKASSEPTYTPDGRHIVFTSNRDSDNERNRSAIFWMRPDGSRVELVVDTPRLDSEPDVSPDGRKVLFISNRSGGHGIHTVNIRTGRVRAVGKPVRTCTRRSCYAEPVYSPDGRHIAATYSGTYGSSLKVMRADGSNSKTFAEGGTDVEGYGTLIGPPAWGVAP